MNPYTIHQAEHAELERRRREVDRLLEDPRIADHGDLALRLRSSITSVRAYVDHELSRRAKVLHLARKVRLLQKAYWASRERETLRDSKAAERQLDELLGPSAPQLALGLEEAPR